MLQQAWLDIYPGLAKLEPEMAELFARSVSVAELEAGQIAFHPGDVCRNWYMLLRGQVRVHQTLADGREIVVCRFFPGKTCIISALGIMADEPYTTEAVAETDIAALVLPADTFRYLLANSRYFREFVFSAYNT